jgi:hypothetical protein
MWFAGCKLSLAEISLNMRGYFIHSVPNNARNVFCPIPTLYMGIPGQKAPKQKGLSVIKQRRLRLAQPLSSSQAKTLSDALQAMMGIQAVSVEGDSVVIAYDLLQATAEQVEEKLTKIGVNRRTARRGAGRASAPGICAL